MNFIEDFTDRYRSAFPFQSIYLVDEDFVDVVAILDCREDPSEITERLRRIKR